MVIWLAPVIIFRIRCSASATLSSTPAAAAIFTIDQCSGHSAQHSLDSAKANAAHKILKALVGAQRIEGRTLENGWVEALLISFFQPDHCPILFVQTGIDQR